MATLVDTVEADPSPRTVTVSIPGPLYDRIQRTAETQHRSFEEVLVEAAAAGLPSRHAR
jgi:hypothetical protein